MEINTEKSININGKECWTVRQFSKLTGFAEPRIRYLIYYGNSQRKLKTVELASNKPMICAEEIFDFPFVLSGRPNKNIGLIALKFFINEKGKLQTKEEKIV
jgi:hypothetical protein